MLLKLFIDDTFPFAKIQAAETVTWLVADHLPLGHPQNIQALFQRISAPRNPQAGDPFGNTYVHVSGRIIDLTKNAQDNFLVGNTVLTCSTSKPMSSGAVSRRRTETQAPENDSEAGGDSEAGDSEAGGGGGGGDDSNSNSSGAVSPRSLDGKTPRGHSRKNSTMSSASNASDGEIYTAPECGWFPFSVSSGARIELNNQNVAPPPPPPASPSATAAASGGGGGGDDEESSASPRADPVKRQFESAKFTPRKITSVRALTSTEEPDPEDPEPRTFELCPVCTQLVTKSVQQQQQPVQELQDLQQPGDRNQQLVDHLNPETPSPSVLHVETHYRPMMVDTDTVRCWLDKLSSGTIQRWQKRWFIITEKSMDWYENQPDINSRDKVKASRMITVEGKFMINKIVEKADSKEYPKADKDSSNCYIFVLEWNGVPNPTYYKAASEDVRNQVCEYLRRLKKRAEGHQGSTRDPVFWKQWANSLLVSASNLAELRVQKAGELKEIQREQKELQSQMDGLNSGREATQTQLAYQHGVLSRLEKELTASTRRNADLDRQAGTVRESVEDRHQALSHSLEKSEDTCHRSRILEQEALAEKKRVIISLTEIREENERLKYKVDQLFSKWRRVEEHHVEAAFRPSTLAPADIAARAARDYEARSGISSSSSTNNNNNNSNLNNSVVGPMAPLTPDVFTPNNKRSYGGNVNSLSPQDLSHSSTSSTTPRTPGGTSINKQRIPGSTLSSPNARLASAVKETLSGADQQSNNNNNSTNNSNLRQAARGGRITFGLSASLGFVPGSPEALSSSRLRRVQDDHKKQMESRTSTSGLN